MGVLQVIVERFTVTPCSGEVPPLTPASLMVPEGRQGRRALGVWAALVLLAGIVACTAGQTQRGPPASPGQMVTGFTERLPDRPGFEVFLRNNAEHRVSITSISIFDCVNLAVWCRTRELDVVLEPGQVRRMVVVEPEDPIQRWNYRWRWTHERGVAARARPSAGQPAPAPILVDEGTEPGEEYLLYLDPRGRFVNLVIHPQGVAELGQGDWSAEQVANLTRIFYRSFQDDFDFVLLALADREAGSDGGRAYRTSRAAEGLGLSGGDRTEFFGSRGRLRAALMHSSHAGLNGHLPLHEVAHTWGQYILPGTDLRGHWGFAGVGGLLGGWDPGTLEAVEGGLWTAREGDWPGPFNLSGPRRTLRPFAPLELYLMGLLPADSVPPVEVPRDAEWVNFREGTFRASAIDTVTAADLVAEHGPRIPAYPEAPTTFRGAYVVVSSAPLDGATRNRIDEDVEDLTRTASRKHRWYLNFWEATDGRGRLVMDGLTDALLPSATQESRERDQG